MPWGRLDDSLYDHPKLDLIPVEERLAAIGLWTRAISWCNRFLTDGLVPRDRIVKLDGTVDLADRLVAAGLFEPAQHGYLVHDFLAFNDSREKILERRQHDADRKAKWRADRDAEKNGRNASGRSHSGTPRTKRASVPGGVTPESQVESPRDSRTRESRPVPSRPIDTPDPAERGGRGNPRGNGTNPRARGTSPRQVAERERAAQAEVDMARRWRAQQRQLAVYRGALSDADRIAMNERDAPLEEIPGYVEHRAALEAERDAPSPLAEADVKAWTT